ncbi:MAG: hypothetical protein ACLQVG_00105 [Terriglobia bacterium]
MKKFVGVAAALMTCLCPEFAVLLFFLYVFWENLGDLTLSIYDDHQLTKTEKALRGNPSANVEGYYVHLLTTRSVAERERQRRAKLAQRLMIKAASRTIAPLSVWVRQVLHGGRRVPMCAATDEE